MNRSTQLEIARLANNPAQLADMLGNLELSAGWRKDCNRFLQFLADGKPRFSVFVPGNSKLPFWCFSALPFVTCPGMGACGKFCYSLKAWRYPAAFFRQLQNTILVRGQSAYLADAFQALPAGTTVRLYVDGDFDSVATLRFWFGLLEERPDVRAYGYSKSWPLFLAYAKQHSFPANYRLNLSSGSRWPDAMRAEMEKLPIVRGRFVTIPVKSTAVYSDKRAWLEHAKEVRQTAQALGHGRVFVCPGRCGTCTARGHACGLDNFKGVTIAIGIH